MKKGNDSKNDSALNFEAEALGTEFWKAKDAKSPAKGLGVEAEGSWYWYEPWLDRVRAHCLENEANYK